VDVETLFNDERSLGVLRSAMWGQADKHGRQDRSITWQTAKGREDAFHTKIEGSGCTESYRPDRRSSARLSAA